MKLTMLRMEKTGSKISVRHMPIKDGLQVDMLSILNTKQSPCWTILSKKKNSYWK